MEKRTTYFQDSKGNVFLIDDMVKQVTKIEKKRADVLALVDADEYSNAPHPILGVLARQIVLTTSPQHITALGWVKQSGARVLMMDIWGESELLAA